MFFISSLFVYCDKFESAGYSQYAKTGNAVNCKNPFEWPYNENVVMII